MGKLNVPSFALLIGSMGQMALLAPIFPHWPPKFVWAFLLPPWLIIYTITFCRQPPFGPRGFRRALSLAMYWYGIATMTAEVLHCALRPAPWGAFSPLPARILMYSGATTFFLYARYCLFLWRLEQRHRP